MPQKLIHIIIFDRNSIFFSALFYKYPADLLKTFILQQYNLSNSVKILK